MHLETYKQLEQTEKDQKTKQKHMPIMLYQEHEGMPNKFYNKQKLIRKKLLQKRKVKQVDF